MPEWEKRSVCAQYLLFCVDANLNIYHEKWQKE